MAQTAAHLVDHVMPPVPVRQWVISVPKRFRGMLADRPRAVAALTHHVHLHACVTDGVFVPAADHAGCDALPTFLPARPITPSDLASLTERVRRRVVRWFCIKPARCRCRCRHARLDEQRVLGRRECPNRDVPSSFQSLEHLLRYCARPPVALERLSVIRDADGRIIRIRYVLPRHKAPLARHLGEPLQPPPVAPARGPPTDWGELVQVHDDRDVLQSSSDELPAIDIHSP